jgi:hypothetical protein
MSCSSLEARLQPKSRLLDKMPHKPRRPRHDDVFHAAMSLYIVMGGSGTTDAASASRI